MCDARSNCSTASRCWTGDGLVERNPTDRRLSGERRKEYRERETYDEEELPPRPPRPPPERPRSDNGVDVKGPGGWGISARGPQVIIFLLGAMVLAGLAYLVQLLHHQNETMSTLIYNQSQQLAVQQTIIDNQTKGFTAIHSLGEQTKRSQEQTKEFQIGVIYVLLLTPKERETLRLDRPDFIRQLERGYQSRYPGPGGR